MGKVLNVLSIRPLNQGSAVNFPFAYMGKVLNVLSIYGDILNVATTELDPKRPCLYSHSSKVADGGTRIQVGRPGSG